MEGSCEFRAAIESINKAKEQSFVELYEEIDYPSKVIGDIKSIIIINISRSITNFTLTVNKCTLLA